MIIRLPHALLIPLVAGPLCLAAPPRALAQPTAQAQTTLRAQAPGEDAARRIVATLQLAANEYRLAWSNGAMTAPAEWEEAKEFVAEARRSAGELPPDLRAQIAPLVAGLAQRLDAKLPPDSLALGASDIERRLTGAIGRPPGERPAREPSAPHG